MEVRIALDVLKKHRENRRDPFHVLGQPRNFQEARQNYRKLVLHLHPDKCREASKSVCEEAFKGKVAPLLDASMLGRLTAVNSSILCFRPSVLTVVNNAFKRIESEYGTGPEEVVSTPPRNAEPAASPTDVAAARSNWASGRQGAGEAEAEAFGRAAPCARAPYRGGTPSTPPPSTRPAPRAFRRWDKEKENLGPVSQVSGRPFSSFLVRR